MTAQGWLQIALFVGGADRAHAAAGRLHGARVPERARVPDAGAGAARAAHLPAAAASTRTASRTGRPTGAPWSCSALLFWLALYLILRTQGIHPFNPEGFNSGPWDLTFNTTSSFVTNTNWQFYGGETTLSYFSQMAGLAVQNFVSAAVGMAVLAAVIRGFASRGATALGNFWQDLTRTLLYILLPLSIDRRAGARLAGRGPDPRPVRELQHRPGRRPDARARPGRLADRRSSSSARTAAGSSTSTARCRSRTRPSSRTSSSCCSSS